MVCRKRPFIEAPEEELLKYVINNVNSYWKHWLSRASIILSVRSIYVLTKPAIEWCALGLARMFFTLSEKDVTSKDQVIEYALCHMPKEYERIIKEA